MAEYKEVEMFTDMLGRHVVVGDWIAYGYNLGRCAAIKLGIVLSIKEDSSLKDYQGRWKIRVRGCEKNYNDVWVATAPGTLSYPSRIIRVDSEAMMSDDTYFDVLKVLEPEMSPEENNG